MSTGIVIPPNTWVRLRVSGELAIGENPRYTAWRGAVPQPNHVGVAAPPSGMGWNGSELRVEARMVTPTNTFVALPLTTSGADSASVHTFIKHGAGGTIQIRRSGIAGGGGCMSGSHIPCSPDGEMSYAAGFYALAGAQEVSAEEMPPAAVDASPLRFALGDTVTFTALLGTGHAVSFGWHFAVGDTLPEPAWQVPGPPHWWATCPSHVRVCRIPPVGAGRMYIRGFLSGTTADFMAVSPVVRVCQPPAAGAQAQPGLGITGDGAGGGLSTCPLPPRLAVHADRHVVEVAGDTVTFTAVAHGAERLTVQRWEWTPADSSGPPVQVCLDNGQACSISIVQSGAMLVSAAVDLTIQSASADVLLEQAEPAARLVCDGPKERGSTMTCTVEVEPAGIEFSVGQWRWEGEHGGSRAGPSDTRTWGGTAVLPGWVSVDVVLEGQVVALRAPWVVRKRDWQWQNAKYYHGLAPQHYDGRDLTLNPTVRPDLGWICEYNIGCPTSRGIINPAPASGNGFAYTQTAPGEPNGGLWYVTSPHYTMYLASNLNKHLLEHGPRYQLVHMDDFAACSGRTEVSLYEYNKYCRQDQDWDQLIEDAWSHERDHGEVGMQLAAQLDPTAVLEGMWGLSEEILRRRVVDRLGHYDHLFGTAILDRVHNARSPRKITIWYWHPIAQRFWKWEPSYLF